jgi:lipopolysaccharide export system permease protein
MIENHRAAGTADDRRTGFDAMIRACTDRYTRYMLAGYLRRLILIAAVLLTIALTIDLWPQIGSVAGNQDDAVPVVLWHIARFAALRTPGLLAPLLPFACFLAVAWTETAYTHAGERLFTWNSGRSPVLCLPASIIFGLIVGMADFTADAVLGPIAMRVQMTERLGSDGQRLDRGRAGNIQWIARPDGLLRTEIVYGPPPELRFVTFFKLDVDGKLVEVDQAARATQVRDTSGWRLENGTLWTAWAPSDRHTVPPDPDATGPGQMTPFDTRVLPLDLDPLWLSVYGIEPQYLPLATLNALKQTDRPPQSHGLFRTRLQALYSDFALPAAMALFAASLSLLLQAHRVTAQAVIGTLVAGYLAHSATKALLVLGENGYLAPTVAAWAVPVALLTATLCAFVLKGARPPDPDATASAKFARAE